MNADHKSSRRNFLKRSVLAGCAGPIIASAASAAEIPSPGKIQFPSGISIDRNLGETRPRPAGQIPVHNLTTTPVERVRVAFIGYGGRGKSLVGDVLAIEFADIMAVCDLKQDRAEDAAKRIEKSTGKRPAVFGGTPDIWEKLCELGNIDVVYVATPWDCHVPMALKAMRSGKHAFVEVAAAVTVEDCWRLVDTSEQAQRHCLILENCCYGENELFVLNMAREGVFGELKHAECSYIHDLRTVLFSLGTEGDWRRDYHLKYDANLYPTHGLGPVSQYLGIGRGDQFKQIVSMSSGELSLSKWRDDHKPNCGRHAGEKYVCGDMNTSLIKTELGRTIMVQHDVVSPRPYSRINALSGTGATFFDYPPRMAIDQPGHFGLKSTGSHEWLTDEDLSTMRTKFTHPLWVKLREQAKGSGHGGMDFVENWRHLDCVRRGVTPDITVYDAAAWSCIIETSALSVATGSAPVKIPDFTRGLWKSLKPLGIAS